MFVDQKYRVPKKSGFGKRKNNKNCGEWGGPVWPIAHAQNEKDLLAGLEKIILQSQSIPKAARPWRKACAHPKQCLDKQRNSNG